MAHQIRSYCITVTVGTRANVIVHKYPCIRIVHIHVHTAQFCHVPLRVLVGTCENDMQ